MVYPFLAGIVRSSVCCVLSFTVIHSRFCHSVGATANMTFFLLLFHTLLTSCSFQLFAILILCTSSTLICTQILYNQSLLVGNTLYSILPHILLWAHRTLFAYFRWLPPLDLPTVLSVLQSQVHGSGWFTSIWLVFYTTLMLLLLLLLLLK